MASWFDFTGIIEEIGRVVFSLLKESGKTILEPGTNVLFFYRLFPQATGVPFVKRADFS